MANLLSEKLAATELHLKSTQAELQHVRGQNFRLMQDADYLQDQVNVLLKAYTDLVNASRDDQATLNNGILEVTKLLVTGPTIIQPIEDLDPIPEYLGDDEDPTDAEFPEDLAYETLIDGGVLITTEPLAESLIEDL